MYSCVIASFYNYLLGFCILYNIIRYLQQLRRNSVILSTSTFFLHDTVLHCVVTAAAAISSIVTALLQ